MSRFVNDIKKYWNYSIYAARSELKTEVANSYLNWIWWVLEPICLAIIYTFIFGYVYNSKEKFFPVFVFTGLTVWDFFARSLKQSVKLVQRNRAIVSKVYIPKIMLINSKMFVNGFKMLVSWGIILGMMIIWRVPISINILYIIPMLLLLWIFTFSCMCFFMHFGVFVEDLLNVTDIVLKLAFYMTGIFYSIERRIGPKFPELATFLQNYNPMAFILTSIRNALIYCEAPNMIVWGIWFAIAVLMAVVGVKLIYKNENNYVKVI